MIAAWRWSIGVGHGMQFALVSSVPSTILVKYDIGGLSASERYDAEVPQIIEVYLYLTLSSTAR
eukprot:scaffold31787_cov92-Skeletonema_dohrnii-CCMP3373.AAC.2